MSQWCFYASLVKIHQLVQEIECRKGSFLVSIVWWPWKLGQGHGNLINSFNYPNDTIHKVWPESIIWFKRLGADKLFGQNLTFRMLVWPWKWGQGHQNLTISSPWNSGVSVQVWSKSTIRYRRYRVQTMLIFTVFIVWWPSKLGQGHGNLINSFNYPNDTVWPESIIWFKR